MESFPNRNTTDEGYDNLIAFLVIIAALSFILTQSFPKKSTTSSAPIATTTVPAKKTKKVYKKKTKPSNYYKAKQEERNYKEEALRDWTDQLEAEQVRNTSFRVPKQATALVAGTVATSQLAEKNTTSPPIAPRQITKEEKTAPSAGTTVIKEEPIFIDTNIKKKEVAKPTPSTVAPTPTIPIRSEETPTIDESIKDASKAEPIVESYKTVSPKISTKSVDEEKAALNSKNTNTTVQSIKKGEASCVIMIAALKDRANIDRLIQSLKKENYEVYNKISGKYRTVGVRTSCDAAIHKPFLREIKKKYSESAFFMKR